MMTEPVGQQKFEDEQSAILALTVKLVGAYVRGNKLSDEEFIALIQTVYDTLLTLSEQRSGLAKRDFRLDPAVDVDDSITDDYLICLEDGKKFKSLKRHLRAKYGLSPEEYRKKWSLPEDYPMVAPNYARTRSRLAKNMGFGKS